MGMRTREGTGKKRQSHQILGGIQARGITEYACCKENILHSQKQTDNRRNPSKSSKSHLTCSSVLSSTYAKEPCLLNSDPTLQTLRRIFLKVLANVSQILFQGIMSGWLPQSLLKSFGKTEIREFCPRNPYSVRPRYGLRVCNSKQICPTDYDNQPEGRITALHLLMKSTNE